MTFLVGPSRPASTYIAVPGSVAARYGQLTGQREMEFELQGAASRGLWETERDVVVQATTSGRDRQGGLQVTAHVVRELEGVRRYVAATNEGGQGRASEKE